MKKLIKNVYEIFINNIFLFLLTLLIGSYAYTFLISQDIDNIDISKRILIYDQSQQLKFGNIQEKLDKKIEIGDLNNLQSSINNLNSEMKVQREDIKEILRMFITFSKKNGVSSNIFIPENNDTLPRY